MVTPWGIDISNHQPDANLTLVKRAGASFVFAKATEGLTYRDPTFDRHRSAARAAGLKFGAYHFARPQAGRSGIQEAQFFLSVLGSVRNGDLPPVLDLEATTLNSAATIQFALHWLRTVEANTGTRPYLYTYSAFAQEHLSTGTALAAYPLWLANYRALTNPPPAPKPWSRWVLWQHTSSATVPGVTGYVDRNVASQEITPLPAVPAAPDEEAILADITPTNPATKQEASVTTALSSIWAYEFLNFQTLQTIAGKVGIDTTDEAAISKAVVAAILPALTTNARALSDADLAAIATAVNDEQGRRLHQP